jgi:hypothetical protein
VTFDKDEEFGDVKDEHGARRLVDLGFSVVSDDGGVPGVSDSDSEFIGEDLNELGLMSAVAAAAAAMSSESDSSHIAAAGMVGVPSSSSPPSLSDSQSGGEMITTKGEPGAIHNELNMLKIKLQAGERERKRLRRILDEVRRADAGADRAFRRAIVRCRRAKNSDAIISTSLSSLVSTLGFDTAGDVSLTAKQGKHGLEKESGRADDDGEEYEETYSDEEDRLSVISFINAVKERVA